MDFKQQQKRAKIGKIIYQARIKKGLSHQDMYFNTGVAITQQKYIENASRNYTIDTLIKIASFLEIKGLDEIISFDQQ